MGEFARLLLEMADEEWVMHASLFGGRRFALFPVVMLCLATGGTAMLVAGGANPGAITAALHAFVLLIGLQTGGIAFSGREGARGLLGDRTLLLFSSRTLPVSPRRLVVAFLLKDVAFYVVLFVAPLALGLVCGEASIALTRSEDVPSGLLMDAGANWVGMIVAFSLGVTTTFAGAALAPDGARRTTRRFGQIVLGAVLGLVLAGIVLGTGTLPSIPRWPVVGAVALLSVLLGAIGVYGFDPSSTSGRSRVGRAYDRSLALFEALETGTPKTRAIAAGTMTDLARSSGGMGKVVFSAGITAVAAIAVVDFVAEVFPLDPAAGLVFGVVLGLIAFPTYSWSTRFDAVDDYLIYPLEASDVYRAKRDAFLAIHLPISLALFLLVTVVSGAAAIELLFGGIALVCVSLYHFGLIVALAGFDANEFLFDPRLFALFSVAISIVLVPLLVVGLVGLLTPLLATVVLGYAFLAGGVGLVLSRRRLAS